MHGMLLALCFFATPKTHANSLAKESLLAMGASVKQFGALGDGKADDTAAIQKALDFASTHKEATPVLLPSGSYVISKPLIMPRNVDLVGQGVGFTSSIIPINCDAILMSGATQEGGYAFRNKLQGFTINMRRSSSGKAIVIEKAYNIKLSEIFIYDAPDIGIQVSSAKHVTFEHVIVYGAGVKKGIGIKVSNSVVNMYNIDIENIDTGLEVGPDQQALTSVSVFGGFIERFGRYGVHILKSSHNTFIGLNIQADQANKEPVNIERDLSAKESDAQNANKFLGGFIGYAPSVIHPKEIKLL
jgi:hypothetical protein